MRNQSKLIEIKKARSVGRLPDYLLMSHRHLEKENSIPSLDSKEAAFTVPVDLLNLTLPITLVDEISEIRMVYARPTKVET